MSAVQHTPGPWTVDEDDLSVSAEVGAQICRVMDFDDFPCIDPDTSDEEAVQAECFANACLIGAAPDLLEALRDLAEYVEGVADEEAFPTEYALLQAALRAIAKAEGRS